MRGAITDVIAARAKDDGGLGRRFAYSLAAHIVVGVAFVLISSKFLSGKQDKPKPPEGSEAKAVSGMSVVGNSETPKSLTIIPWKSSEIGRDSDFKSSLLNQDLVPIDKPSFLRQLEFHKLSNRN